MFQDKKIISLFPTFVWVHELKKEAFEPMNARLLEEVDALIAPRPPLRPGQSWQTETFLHRREAFAGFLPYIREAVTGVLEFMAVDNDRFEITGCWANVNPQGVPHATHSHPNNYLSGVYYLRAPAGGDAISFYDPRPQPNIIAPRVRRMNNNNSSQLNLPAQEGALLIFPAWLKHSVAPNTSETERVSISFNIMFSAFTETESPTKWQGLSGQATQDRGGA